MGVLFAFFINTARWFKAMRYQQKNFSKCHKKLKMDSNNQLFRVHPEKA